MVGNLSWLVACLLPLAGFDVGSGFRPPSPPAVQQIPSLRHAASAASKVLTNGSRATKSIALTFDACPAPKVGGYDSAVTQILIQTGTPATIFLSGLWMKNHPTETKLLGSLPQFEIGTHSYSHPHLKDLSDSLIMLELGKTQNLLKKLTGKKSALFRPPYGEYDERVARVARDFGQRLVEFDLASGDPDTAISAKRLISYIARKAQNGSIILMHINKRGRHTAEILPEVISQLRSKGFKFVKISELASD